MKDPRYMSARELAERIAYQHAVAMNNSHPDPRYRIEAATNVRLLEGEQRRRDPKGLRTG